jgi:hypothetical protein
VQRFALQRARDTSSNLVAQIAPVAIVLFDELELPRAPPALEGVLAGVPR